MTTRNVRLSDDDIDRLLEWYDNSFPCGSIDKSNDWLRDRLLEAKLSPSMDWPAWPDGGADKREFKVQPPFPIGGLENLLEHSTEKPGER